jgi:hypothetical protein
MSRGESTQDFERGLQLARQGDEEQEGGNRTVVYGMAMILLEMPVQEERDTSGRQKSEQFCTLEIL